MDILQSLLGSSMSVADFFEHHWEAAPLHIRRGHLSYYAQLAVDFDDAALLRLLKQRQLEQQESMRVVKVGADGRRHPAPAPTNGIATSEWVRRRLAEGFTVQLFQPQRHVEELAVLISALEARFSCLCGCSSYHTPPGSQGLAAHHDDVEVFILQTQGQKRWQLFAPVGGHALPRTPSTDLSVQELGPCTHDLLLEPGDLLYLPRGVVHQARTTSDFSTHLTLSTYQRHAWADLLAAALPAILRDASASSLPLRRGLPLGLLSSLG
eukprot:CAMPEP_0183344192 /NCGR_PEP_ID=MMETSP0164_2-20130417/9932_1 /TAXON_ID=221442 /ORGANISM="Coccolithus pelagicus ssp braarudi, Strain PLY182g" /LENGTH=266 /DNA_ID=CAMNT_0025515157 /DNA_START=99 /DNA_END=896 /DNA_ORIENTATION=+